MCCLSRSQGICVVQPDLTWSASEATLACQARGSGLVLCLPGGPSAVDESMSSSSEPLELRLAAQEISNRPALPYPDGLARSYQP